MVEEGSQSFRCPLHWEWTGLMHQMPSWERFTAHADSYSRFPTTYKCQGGAGADCRRSWAKHESAEFVENMALYHSTEDPDDLKFRHGDGTDGQYCGYCVAKVLVPKGDFVHNHLRRHYAQKPYPDTRMWIRSNNVDMSDKESATMRAKRAIKWEDSLEKPDLVSKLQEIDPEGFAEILNPQRGLPFVGEELPPQDKCLNDLGIDLECDLDLSDRD
ncbi:hypothetical protein TWF281_007846 [Arthrobotrys megalospora]